MAVALAAGGLWLATFGSFEQEVRLSAAADYPLPPFRLPVLDNALFAGDTAFLAPDALEGKVVLVSFWATWCAPCIAEMPSLAALQRELGGRGLVAFGVLHEDRPRTALRWLADNDSIALRTVVGDASFARGNRVGGLPHTLLVDRSGTVRERFLGYWPERDPYLRRRVTELLGAS